MMAAEWMSSSWVTLPRGWYALSLLSEGWITLQPDAQGALSVVRRPKRGKPVIEYTDLPTDWAQSVGEGIAKQESQRGLPMYSRAAWLDRPISEGQLRYGLSIGLPLSPETTSWEMKVMEAEHLYATRWQR